MAYATNKIKKQIEEYLETGDKSNLINAIATLDSALAIGWWTRDEIEEYIYDTFDITELSTDELDYLAEMMEEHCLNNWETIYYSIDYAIDNIIEWREENERLD